MTFKIIKKYQILSPKSLGTTPRATNPTHCPIPWSRDLLKGNESSVLTLCSLPMEQYFPAENNEWPEPSRDQMVPISRCLYQDLGGRSVKLPDPNIVC